MSIPPAPFDGLAETRHMVWDRFVRLFHWSLAGCIAATLVTGFLLDATWIQWHLAAGILAVMLVMARIVWGFTGTAYSRFLQFVPRPREIADHLKHGAAKARHIGHNPLGGIMVLALLAAVLALGITGTALLGSSLKTGPLAFALPATQGEFWSEIHEALAFLILVLVALHIAGVLFESHRSRENLARAMVTGSKERREADLIASPRPAYPLLASGIIAGLVIATAAGTAGFSARKPEMAPVSAVPEIYQDECAACHMAFHPSLRPAASWSLMIGQLSDHFGEDARLPEETSAEISAWLEKHAAATVDSKPAVLWRNLREATPLALTDTPQWQRLHEDVDPSVFKRRPIHSRSNCIACHRDAETGWFSPFDLKIPKETGK
jgi:cytochrome b